MKNILILNGSPRKNGKTASLVTAFTEGAKAALEFYRIFTDIMKWKNWGTVLGAGKENEARELGASIQ